MHLYHLSLQRAQTCLQAVVGNFSASPRTQEVCMLHGNTIELFGIDANQGRLTRLSGFELMATARRLAVLRLPGNTHDHLIVSDDGGSIAVLEYRAQDATWTRLQCEVFGKTGLRRLVPGEYLVADPKGRACMIAAVEKQKFVYVLNRDTNNPITISSPLAAHSASTITFALTALDAGYENPTFAAIEVDYSDDESGKQLVYYELDLGLNHVVRKWSTSVDRDAHFLLALPGGSDGPGGVLVMSPGKATWHHVGYDAVEVEIPPRPTSLSLGFQELPVVVSGVMHRMKGFFFGLIQTEQGDLFKLTFEYSSSEGIGGVDTIQIQYYDTVAPSSSLLLLKAGFLFVATEFGNHELYQIDNLGDDDDTQHVFSSNNSVEPFNARPLRNLLLTSQMDNLAPLLNSHVQEPTGESHVIYTFSGRDAKSTMRVLQPGITASELAVSELPGAPTRLWTLAADGNYDSHIIVSFLNATLVLQMDDEGNVEEMSDSPLLGTVATLALFRMGQGVVQIHAGGVRHVRNFLTKPRIHEWKTPAGKTVIHAAVNLRQVALALSSGEIVYFEQDQTTGLLNEYAERVTLDNVTCLAMAKVDPDRLRSRFLVVGARDNTVRVLSLDKDRCLQVISMQALSAAPASCSLVTMEREGEAYLVLQTGLENGLLYRTIVDALQGTLSDTRIRFLGAKPVQVIPVQVGGKEAVFCLSSKPWLSYSHAQSSRLTPVAYDGLDHVSSFHTPQCEEGFVGISGNVLKIFTVDNLDQQFTATELALAYTPRGIHVDPSGLMVVLESENRTMTPAERAVRQDSHKEVKEVKKRKRVNAAMLMDADEPVERTEPSPEHMQEYRHWGYPRAENGHWSSMIRVVSPDGKTLQTLDLGDEAAFSICPVVFANKPDASYLAVGTAKRLQLAPRRVESGFIRLYKMEAGKLTFQNETAVEDVPYALVAFQGRLLASVGKLLRIYELGKKKLLRKCECNTLPNLVTKLHTQGNRIIAADVAESLVFIVYNHEQNRLFVFADDFLPRYIVSTCMLDYDTFACGDKFGNFFVLRLPKEVSEDLDDDPTGNKAVHARPFLQAAAYKLQSVCEFHVGDIVTSIHRTSMTLGGREVLFLTTLGGSLRVMIPFTSKDDVETFSTLEMHLRQERVQPTGRNHAAWRGSLIPVKAVVDGDLCELFTELSLQKRLDVAEAMERSPADVSKKLEDIRTRNAF